MEGNKFSPTDVFSIQHDYDLFLLNQGLHTPSDNLNHQDTHLCEKQGQDDYLIHATDLSHNFALPQFITQHNYEDLIPLIYLSQTQSSTQMTSLASPSYYPLKTMGEKGSRQWGEINWRGKWGKKPKPQLHS